MQALKSYGIKVGNDWVRFETRQTLKEGIEAHRLDPGDPAPTITTEAQYQDAIHEVKSIPNYTIPLYYLIAPDPATRTQRGNIYTSSDPNKLYAIMIGQSMQKGTYDDPILDRGIGGTITEINNTI